MPETIGNPLSWSVDHAKAVSHHLGSVASHVGHETDDLVLPQVRRIQLADLPEVLRRGVDDFMACRTDVAFLCLLYPAIGLLVAWFALDRNLLPLLFPAVSGLAIVGPVAAVGLYEMSRQREMGLEPGWSHAFAVVKSPNFGAILALGLMLGALFIVWILTAHGIFVATMGAEAPASIGAFARDVATTPAGLTMAIVGIAVGALFAALALAVSVVSFPLLLDRGVGVPAAVITSLRVTAANPVPVAAWGAIVATSLVLGSIPLFLGLIVVMPILGHATWHLYRRTVV
ncbi:MAG: DUF2189 domain-containing protein [Amaricoccus sp.]|uniref:DUF2189 domain-containing protein n=1 Tax=Amaricoccus sp. TaxID=1872485 RepID=UPI0039E27F9F